MKYIPNVFVKNLLLLIYILNTQFLWGQGSGIGIGTTSVDPSAVLEIKSANNNQGLLVARVTDRANISVTSASKGLIVYDTGDDGFYYYEGTNWLRLVAFSTNLDLNMDSHKIVNLANGTSNTDAVNKGQMDAADDLQLSESGGTMSGDIDMGGNSISNLDDASAFSQAVNYGQLITRTTGLADEGIISSISSDWNDIISSGVYASLSGSSSNSPGTGKWTLIVTGNNAWFVYQMAFKQVTTGTTQILSRNKFTTWSNWYDMTS